MKNYSVKISKMKNENEHHNQLRSIYILAASIFKNVGSGRDSEKTPELHENAKTSCDTRKETRDARFAPSSYSWSSRAKNAMTNLPLQFDRRKNERRSLKTENTH